MATVRCIGGPLDGLLILVAGARLRVPDPLALAALPPEVLWRGPPLPEAVYVLRRHAVFPTALAYVWADITFDELLARWLCLAD